MWTDGSSKRQTAVTSGLQPTKQPQSLWALDLQGRRQAVKVVSRESAREPEVEDLRVNARQPVPVRTHPPGQRLPDLCVI